MFTDYDSQDYFSPLSLPDYSAMPSLGTGARGPKRPSFLNAFQAGMQQHQQSSPLLSGLNGALAGRGGFLGGIGKAAGFFI